MIQKKRGNKESLSERKIKLSADDCKEIDKSMLYMGINIVLVQVVITLAFIIFYGANWYSINMIEIAKPIRSWCIGLYILTSIIMLDIFTVSYIVAIKRYKESKYGKEEGIN